MDIYKLLLERFADGDSIAITDFCDVRISYKDLAEHVNHVAAQIVRRAVPGGRLAVVAEDQAKEAVFILAGLACGCTVVPTSAKYGAKLCGQILSLSSPSLIVTDMAQWREATSPLDDDADILTISELQKKDGAPELEIDGDSDALIMFTSGTTGAPKGAVLTHRNIVSNVLAISNYFKISSGDTMLIARPLYHAAVMTSELLAGLFKGLTVAFYKEDFSPQRMLGYIEKNQISVLCGTPTMFNYLAYYATKFDVGLKHAAISGEVMPPGVARRIAKAFPDTDIYHVYGLTEASPRVAYLSPAMFGEKPCSIGKPIDGVEARIVGESGECGANEVGELTVRGANVMKGYWREPELTEKKIIDGWLQTGDMAYADDDGYLYVLGRKDNMIIRAGINIYPQEIEDVLVEMDEIGEALVYGRNDERFGQKIIADVVLNSTVGYDRIIQACRESLPEHKWPSEFNIVDEIEKNPSGKVSRKQKA